jgi:hypothetical protein
VLFQPPSERNATHPRTKHATANPDLIGVRRLQRVFLLSVAGFVLPAAPRQLHAAPSTATLRAGRLEAFFKAHTCPAPYHIDDYLDAADLNDLDYRILPAVSVRESTCGRHGRLNNVWGWDSAHTGFESIARGIHYIAYQLAFGRYYRGKSVEQKLLIYNPNPQYVKEVHRLMLEIDGD